MNAVGRSVGLVIVVALAALGLGGCGDDGSPAAPDALGLGGETGTVSVPDGTSDATSDGSGGGSGAVGGEDFPIAAPAGLVLDALADSGLSMDSQRQLYYADSDFDRVVAFYDDWTSENGEWFRGEAEGTVVYQFLGGDGIRSITITPGHDPGAQADGPVTFVLLVAG